ncbi:hypothetical protein GCM10027346_16570 [Hymenobacter seoulensis]
MKNPNALVGAGLLLAGAVYFLSSRKQGHSKPKRYFRGDVGKRFTDHFDPDAGQPISVSEATKLAKKYKKRYKDNTSSNYCNIKVIETIKQTTDCYGIRIYRTLDDEGFHGIAVVGVDKQGVDIINTKAHLSDATLVARSYEKCPYNCDGTRLIQ